MFKSVEPDFSRNSLTFCSHSSDTIYLASVLSISFITLSALSFYILNITPTHADTSSATASVTVPSACTLTSTITSGNAHSTTMVAGTFQEDIGTTNLKAICNDPDGLDIYAVGYSSNTLGNTNLVGDNGLNIATGLNTSSSTGNGNSNWAMKLFFPASTDVNANTAYQPNILSDTNGSYAEYHVIPSTSTKVASFNAVTDTTVGSNLNTTYRIYLEQNQPAGTYVGQVKYTITHPNTSFSLYMQDFTPEMCNTLGTAVTKTVTLYDKRDDNSYTVTYINGQCWMTQNLRITGTISSAESNFSGSSVNISQEDLAIDTPGNTFCLSSDPTACNYYAVPMTHIGVDGNSDPAVWYNFCAASATTSCDDSALDAARDICPVGWRLPSGPNAVEGTDFNNLFGNATDGWQPSSTGGLVAFSPTTGGYYFSGAIQNDFGGHWWSATNYSADTSRMYYLAYQNDSYRSGPVDRKYIGKFVRCVLETRDITDIEYMQEISPSIARNTAVGTITTLKDIRDETTYKVGKLDDDRIWMLDNLAIDLTDSTVQANLTSSTTNASDVSLGYLKGTTSRDPNTDPNGNYATAGVVNRTTGSGSSNSAPFIATSGVCRESSMCANDPTTSQWNKDSIVEHYGVSSGKIGVYYNFCAASAGSYCYGGNSGNVGTPVGDATEDVCPAGWSIPTGGLSGDYQSLCDTLMGSACSDDQPMDATDTNSLQTKISLTLSGANYGANTYGQSSYSDFWTSTKLDDTRMYYFFINKEVVYPRNGYNRYDGRSVRCIVKQ